ncbi:MAG: DUF1345 domain-containing protein [Bacteriovorax sp.]|nr:DUF1345 domain-containing protein [Bacteriovorax sp.]
MNTITQTEGIYRHYLVRLIRSRPHLFISFFFGLAVELFLPNWIAKQPTTRHILALNSGAIFYLIMATQMMFFSDHKKMLQRSELQDEGQVVILFLALGAVTTSLVAIVAELSAAKELHGFFRYEHIALAALTILTSWCFTHLIFALHYAHDYYLNLSHQREGGLEFPGNKLPDYADFLYFSCVIGTSGQTADVSFRSRKMRRVGGVHCVFSFFFNTTILALTINIASGLF